jgi:hypothetical protein
MAYDPSRGVVVMFGGMNGAPLGDTWEYDGTWRAITPVGPPPPARREAGMAYDPVRRRIVLTGGVGAAGDLGDTWLWDGMQWTDASAASTPRAMHVMASDPIRGGVISFGPDNVTRRWDGTSWTTPAVASPSFTVRLGGSYDAARGRSVFFGGQIPLSGALWELDGETWIQGPSGPPPRSAHAQAYDPARRNVVVFGGDPVLDDTWTYDGTWSQHLVTGPSARAQCAMAFDGDRVILFGGVTPSNPVLDETWAWDGTAWTQLQPTTAPPPRTSPAMAYDPLLDRVVLFGGFMLGGVYVRDTWIWDGADWTEIMPPERPPARRGATLAWDPARKRLVLFGGEGGGGTSLSDAWELDGDRWERLALFTAPPKRMDHAMSSLSHGIVVFGGFDGNLLNDLWRLRWEHATRDDACIVGSDLDDDGLEGCADPDCWSKCTPLCPPGTPASCAQSTPHCGDGTCGPVESCRHCPGDCGACDVCGDATCDGTETIATCPGDCTP